MNIKNKIDQDLKQALLGGDKVKATTLRGLKGAILNLEIAENKRESGLTDDEVIGLLQKEAKRRQESADLFAKGGNEDKASAELVEKTLIETYLPEQMSETEVRELVDAAVDETKAQTMQDMGKVIGMVKQRAGAAADGALIARLTKERLS